MPTTRLVSVEAQNGLLNGEQGASCFSSGRIRPEADPFNTWPASLGGACYSFLGLHATLAPSPVGAALSLGEACYEAGRGQFGR
jgi:hypothetical protein